jgi:hypothetical protein
MRRSGFAEKNPPERPRHTIQGPKVIVTIAWNPLGFHLLDAIPKGNTPNAEYYRVNLLKELLPLRSQADGRIRVVHAGNARPDTARKYRDFAKKIGSAWQYTHRTQLISHHPSSFFSDISSIVCRNPFLLCEELLAAIHEIVGAIPRPTSEDVFRHWMERFEWVSQNNGDYYL